MHSRRKTFSKTNFIHFRKVILYRSDMHISLSRFRSSSSVALCFMRKFKIQKFVLSVLGMRLKMEWRRSSDESTGNEKKSRWLKTFYIPLWPLTFHAMFEHGLDTRVSRERDPRARSTSKEFSSRLGALPFDRARRPRRFSPTRRSRVYLTSWRDSRSRQVGRSIPRSSAGMTSVLFHGFLHAREVWATVRRFARLRKRMVLIGYL